MTRATIRGLLALGAFAVLTACGEQTGPQVDDPSALPFGPREAGDQADLVFLRHSPDAPPLESYDTSFTAVQGQSTQFILHYCENPCVGTPARDGPETVGPWFMRVLIPGDAQLLDETGTPLAEGDSVAIAVRVDQVAFLVEFGAHGSTFLGRRPARLEFSVRYAVAAPDPATPDLFYRARAGDPWTALSSQYDLLGQHVQAPIYHFSGYAVAW